MINSQLSMLMEKKNSTSHPKIFQMHLSETTCSLIHNTSVNPKGASQDSKGKGLGTKVCGDSLFHIWLHLVNLQIKIPSGDSRSVCSRFSITYSKLQASLKVYCNQYKWGKKTIQLKKKNFLWRIVFLTLKFLNLQNNGSQFHYQQTEKNFREAKRNNQPLISAYILWTSARPNKGKHMA